ncbi:MAG: hypothetical protein NUV57_02160 [archaeon]|nr:hypothetical protein [archaeon]
MFIEKPAFPVSVDLSEAGEKVSNLLKEKHWNGFTFSSTNLIYVPYYFYSYDVVEETEKKTNHVFSGSKAFNAFNKEFDSAVADLILLENVSRSNEVSEEDDPRVLVSKMNESEAKEILLIKTASLENTSKKNVMISGLEMFYVPFWIAKIEVKSNVSEAHELNLRINATTGNIVNKSSVPFRDKGFSELTSEAFEELSNPSEWIKYSVELVSKVSKGFNQTNGKPDYSLSFSNPDVLILILAIIAILVILWVAYL